MSQWTDVIKTCVRVQICHLGCFLPKFIRPPLISIQLMTLTFSSLNCTSIVTIIIFHIVAVIIYSDTVFRFIQQKLESAPVQEREAVFQVFKSLLFDFSNCLIIFFLSRLLSLIIWPEIWSSSGIATFLPFPHDWCVRKLCYSGNTPRNDNMLKKT